MGVVGWGSPLLLIFCILGWGRGVHVLRLLAAQTAPFQLLASSGACSMGLHARPLLRGQGCTHSSDSTVIPASLFPLY